MQTAGIDDQDSQWEQAEQVLQELNDYVCGAVGRDELHEVEHEVFRRLQWLGLHHDGTVCRRVGDRVHPRPTAAHLERAASR